MGVYAPRGWNSYDYYDTTVTEEDVLKNAEFMARHMKPYGYEYVVVDIQWYAHAAGSRRKEYQYIPFSELEMDGYGRLMPDPERFPSSAGGKGFLPLSDKLHAMGLKFGIHIMRGIPRNAAHRHLPVFGSPVTANEVADPYSISRWNPDMYGVKDTEDGRRYYESIISLYDGWGVDFIKCDDICNTNMYPQNPYSARHEVEMLSNAIKKVNPSIVLSLSPGPALIEQAAHYEKYANMWRITDDFWDDWDLLKDMFARCELWQRHVRAGSYPDCDMLPVGTIGGGFGDERETSLTYEEQRTMLTLWCLFGSPLMVGAELTKLDEETLSLLTNEEILAMSDVEAVPEQYERNGEEAIWTAKNDATGETYLALFNLSDEERELSCNLADIPKMPRNTMKWKELWTKREEEAGNGWLNRKLLPHGCAVYKTQIRMP